MRPLTRRGRFVVPVGLALRLVTACGGGDGDGSGGQGGAAAPTGGGKTTTAAVKAYDPPLKFQDLPAHEIAGGLGDGIWSAELQGTTAYAVSDEELRAVSVLDGEPLWSVTAEGQLDRDTDYGTDVIAGPHLVEIDGQPAVLAAFSVIESGSGTTPDRRLVELTAVAADSGERLWSTTLERPAGHEEGDPYFAGADSTTAVLTFGDERDAVTVGVSFLTHKTAWTQKGFHASFVDSGIVVGRGGANSDLGGEATVEGRKVGDGSKAWTYMDRLYQAELSPVGGGLFTAEVDASYETESDVAALLATSTGKQPAGLLSSKALGRPDELSCWFDGRSAVLCEAGEEYDERVVALDPESWTELWTIDGDDESRLMPHIATVFHGSAYGETENGFVVLDARTGEDKASGAGEAPFEVNEYAGLYPTSLGAIEAHRAVG